MAVNRALEDSIRFYIQQGYTRQQIVDYLVSFGYPPNDVNDTYGFVEKNPIPEQKEEGKPEKIHGQQAPQAQPKAETPRTQKPPVPRSYTTIFIIAGIIIFILLSGFGAAAYWYATLPVCGNGEVEEGETMETCCEDTGCLGDQDCVANACVEPTCGYCEYLEDHSCKKWACCSSDDCAEDERCEDHACYKLDCLECQYYLNHACHDYPCCTASDCGANFMCVDHECIENCTECQYMVDGMCVDYECCSDDDCAENKRCESNFCVPVLCDVGDVVKDHTCESAERCNSNAECDDSNNLTLDLCIGAGSFNSYCTHLDADQCAEDEDCDDDDFTTDDQCVGTPLHCVNQKRDCDEFGTVCTHSDGVCSGNITLALDTAYCCLGECITLPDLTIKEMDEDYGILEVEIEGNNLVDENKTFKIFAFENSTQMETSGGEPYAEINGKNATDKFYFNITIFNATINVTAVVDYENMINETNESNNNMTIEVFI